MKDITALRETLWTNKHDEEAPLEPKMEEKVFLTIYNSEGTILKRSDAFDNTHIIFMKYNELEFVSIPDMKIMITLDSLLEFVNKENLEVNAV